MAPLLHYGQVVGAHAHATPERVGAADLGRSMTFRDWHARACRLANALLGLGLDRGDRVAVLAYNRIEWLEIYAAAAHAGLVAVPINFRLVGAEARYIVDDAGAKALIVEDALWPVVAEVLDELPFGPGAIVCIGEGAPTGAIAYEDLLAKGAETVPGAGPGPGDPWCLMYTSGTTGNPKGAIRSHGSQALMALTIEVELGFSRRDHGLLVMPMCPHCTTLG